MWPAVFWRINLRLTFPMRLWGRLHLCGRQVHLQHLFFWSGWSYMGSTQSKWLVRWDSPRNLMWREVVGVLLALPVLEVALIHHASTIPMFIFFRLLEDSPDSLWLRDGHRVEPKSAEVGCLARKGSITVNANILKMTVRGTNVRSEVCNAGCFCLES